MTTAPPDLQDRYLGCLLAGAVGDALGAPLERCTIDEIHARFAPTSRDPFGPLGIRKYAPAYGRRGAITDDTQLTLFTAEGLLRAHNRQLATGLEHPGPVLYRAYLRWLETQRTSAPPPRPDGWLASLPELYQRRGPGQTCLSALRSGVMGTRDRPINNSKGCGGVMRVAPAGLALPFDAFELGSVAAAITHTHPLGYLAAGLQAEIIRGLIQGETLTRAVERGLRRLRAHPEGAPLHEQVERAMYRAELGDPSPDELASLGEGWVAEEALAMGLYCAASVDTLEDGVALAVLHGGDSDSTGAIAGNLLGAMYGMQAIPDVWVGGLELAGVIRQVALDLYLHFAVEPFEPSEADWKRYPG